MPQKRTETAQNQKKAVPPYKDVKTGGFVGNGEKMTVNNIDPDLQALFSERVV